jgi:hypothetical protein
MQLERLRPDCVRTEADGLGPVTIVSNGASLYVHTGDRDVRGDLETDPVWTLNGIDCRGSVHVDVPADGEPWEVGPHHFYLGRADTFSHDDATAAGRKKCRALLVAFLEAFAASEAGAAFITEGRGIDAQEDVERLAERLGQLDEHRNTLLAAMTEARERVAVLGRGEPDPGAVTMPDTRRDL